MKSEYFKLNKWLVGLIFAVLVLAFFWKTVFFGYVTIPADILKTWYPWQDNGSQPHNTVIADIINMTYPFETFVNQSFKEGDFPLWNPYIFSGTPLIAKGPYVFYPVIVLLQLLFFPLAAHQIFIMLHLFLAGVFMYLLMKNLGIGEFSALIGGIIWMFNGSVVVWLGFKHMVISAALFPLIVLAFNKSVNENSYFYSLLAGLFLGLILISGLYVGYYVMIFLGMYAIFHILIFYKNKEGRKINKLLTLFLFTILIGILLSAVQLLPMAEFMASSTRSPRPLTEIFLNAWTNYLLLFTFFIPKLFGAPTHPGTLLFPGNLFNEFQGYMGILPFILAVFAAVYMRKKIIYFFAGMAIFSLALSLKTPLYLLFYHLLPGFNNLEPGRILFLYAFCISILAGFGMDYILTGGRVGALLKFNKFWQALFSVILIAFSILDMFLYFGMSKIIQFISHNIKIKSLSIQFYIKLMNNFNISNPNFLIFIFVFALSLLFLSLYARKSLKSGYFQIAAFGLIVFDLFSYGINYNTNIPPALVYPKMKSLQLLQNDRSTFRVMSLNNSGEKKLIMPYDTKMPYRIQDIDGYDTMYMKNYAEFMGLVEDSRAPLEYHYILPSHYNSRLLNLLNVKYILTAPDKSLDEKRFELLHKDGMRIYRNNDYLPRVFIAPRSVTLTEKKDIFNKLTDINFDPAKTVIIEERVSQAECPNGGNSSAQITSYKPNRVDIQAQMEKGGFLVLTDSYAPGWQVFVDGKKDKIYRAYYIFRCVYLPMGNHRIEFIYRPMPFIIGRNISISVILSVFGAIIYKWLRPKKYS